MNSRRSYLKLLPVFILFVLIFKYLYVDNGFTKITEICVPIFAGLLLAVILNPILIFIERTLKIKSRALSIVLTFVIFIGAITVLIYFVLPSITSSISGFAKDVPDLLKAINQLLNDIGTQFYENSTNDIYLMVEQTVQKIMQTLYSLGTSVLNTAFISAINVALFLYNTIMAMFISIYILYDKEHFENLFYKASHSIFEKKYADEIVKTGYNLYQNVTKFIAGKLIDSLIIGIIAFIVPAYIIKAPYPIIIGVVIGVTNMIPYFGPFIGGIPMIILTLLYSPIKALWMTIFILILQQFDGWIL